MISVYTFLVYVLAAGILYGLRVKIARSVNTNRVVNLRVIFYGINFSFPWLKRNRFCCFSIVQEASTFQYPNSMEKSQMLTIFNYVVNMCGILIVKPGQENMNHPQ